MVKKPIEYYTIATNHWVFETQREVVLEVETFDSFEEARSHIYDKNEDGSYKYHSVYGKDMECRIRRYYICPEMPVVTMTDEWKYDEISEFQPAEHSCFSKKYAYKGFVN